jgi:hypothetical protein
MDMDIVYRIGAMAFGLLLAYGGVTLITHRPRKAAKARQLELSRANADYWSRPARIRRSRSKSTLKSTAR